MGIEKLMSVLFDKTTSFKIFHIVFSVVILIASLKTAVEALNSSNWALFALAAVEAIAAILFVFPRFTQISGKVLMVIFLLAVGLTLAAGLILGQLHLIIYFVCTYFIVVLDKNAQTDGK